jgi:hypothetical protein
MIEENRENLQQSAIEQREVLQQLAIELGLAMRCPACNVVRATGELEDEGDIAEWLRDHEHGEDPAGLAEAIDDLVADLPESCPHS